VIQNLDIRAINEKWFRTHDPVSADQATRGGTFLEAALTPARAG
jgi:hypothetical protein